jgi:ubiquinone biosynthesis protein
MLLNQFLRNDGNRSSRAIDELLVEQRRTNRLLQGLVYSVVGFALGLLMMQIIIRVRLF